MITRWFRVSCDACACVAGATVHPSVSAAEADARDNGFGQMYVRPDARRRGSTLLPPGAHGNWHFCAPCKRKVEDELVAAGVTT